MGLNTSTYASTLGPELTVGDPAWVSNFGGEGECEHVTIAYYRKRPLPDTGFFYYVVPYDPDYKYDPDLDYDNVDQYPHFRRYLAIHLIAEDNFRELRVKLAKQLA